MKKYYVSGDFFLLRTPLYPFYIYIDLFSKPEWKLEDLGDMQKAFEESLAVATHDLFPVLQNGKALTSDVKKTIAKYLIRGTTRATPFGLFSGVSLGKFDKKTDLLLGNVEKDIKRGRVDLGWLYKIIKTAESDIHILECLKVKYNFMCYNKGDRLINPFFTNAGSRDSNDSRVSIKSSAQTEYICTKAKEFILFSDLRNDLKVRNPQVDLEILENFLKNLVLNEYLITELRTPLVNTDAIEHVIKILGKIEAASSLYQGLIGIQYDLHQYNITKVGRGNVLYNIICTKMAKIQENTDYLQVDSAKTLIRNSLGESVKKEAEKVVNMLATISDFSYNPSYITEYKQAFLEKYGNYTTVSILEVFDENIGLGAPAGYSMPISKRQTLGYINPHSDKLSSFIKNKVFYAISNHLTEVRFTEEECARFQQENSQSNLPISLEIYLELLTEDEQNIDCGNFSLMLSGACLTPAAGKTLGRFGDMLDAKVGEYIYNREKKLLPKDTVLVEISEMPRNGRTGNVVENRSGIPLQISLATNSCNKGVSIDASDLYIGIDVNNNFYVKSKTLGKKLLIKSTNMLNPTYGSNIFRFLKEISYNNNGMIQSLRAFWDFDIIYTPRIIFSKTILSPAQWEISTSLLEQQEEQSFDKKIKTIQKEWKIPRFVSYGRNDNRLLLDLYNKDHINILQDESKKQEIMILKEAFHDTQSKKTWLKDSDGNPYVNEFVIPFFLNSEGYSIESAQEEKCSALRMQNPLIDVSNKLNESILIPFEKEWIYLKSNELIELVNLFGIELVQKCLAEKFFFIRYADPQSHIRFRIKFKRMEQILYLLQDWLASLREKGLVFKVQIDTYEREAYRYGGKALIDIAENYFYYDTRVIGKLISRKDDSREDYWGILNILEIMDSFGLDKYEMLEWMSLYISNSEYRTEFKQNRNKILETINYYDKMKLHFTDITSEIEERKEALYEYKRYIDLSDDTGILTNSKEEILSSLIHMSCNRYKGNNDWEHKIRALTRHGLYAFLQQEKWKQKQTGESNGRESKD